ncbi:vitamin K epoxide reductase family protein [Rhodopirellula bahusiensis]|uniref:vitamin K epoxide reductase family protein n=1 Tax=Rhodopirellula bahusiensis TaxID=2014065 RepID=UPI003267B42D
MATVDLHSSVNHLSHSPLNWRESAGGAVSRIRVSSWWLMLACSIVALGTSSYLAYSSFTQSPVAGCSGGSVFDCGHVLHSRWSKVATIPVSVPAILTHVSVIALLLFRPISLFWKRVRWGALGVAALSAGGAALWFLGLQVFALGHLCPYCMVAHVAGLVLAGTFLYSRPLQTPSLRYLSTAAVAGLAAMITLQVSTQPPETFEVIEHSVQPATFDASGSVEASETFAAPGVFEAPTSGTSAQRESVDGLFAPPESVSKTREATKMIERAANFDFARFTMAMVNPGSLLSVEVEAPQSETPKTAEILGGVRLATKDWPLVGKQDAEMVFVEMFDYTCPHCQRTHESLKAAEEHFGDRLAVIMLPVPLDGQCNPEIKSTHASHREACDLAKLAVAVWIVDREKFGEFHAYMFDSKPTHSQALSYASQLVDEAKLKSTLSGSTPTEYIQKHIQLYQRAGAGTIPKLLFPKTTTVGAVESSQSMIRLIEQHL